MKTLVFGLGVAGQAVAAELSRRGDELVLADDRPSASARAAAGELGVPLIEAPDATTLAEIVGWADRICPAPGVPETHPLIDEANRHNTVIKTEIDLAYAFEQQRVGGPRPILAVTGTDGKTTTTLLAAHLLAANGVRAAAVGNTEVPFVAQLDADVDVFVVECSSFRLNWLDDFRAEAAVWLNLAPDHQNWHRSAQHYEQAKANIWANARRDDAAIGFVDDPAVLRNLGAAACRQLTFGLTGADYHLDGDALVGPHGVLCRREDLPRDLPHDVTNTLAAAALCIESGLLDAPAVGRVVGSFVHPPHRIEPLGAADGVRWFNDSKATTPHAALTAIRGFEQVVLIAGGKNKDLDLTELATEPGRVRAVVAIGAAADQVADAFSGRCPVRIVRGAVNDPQSMDEVVAVAASLTEAGDAVLLSPACASFDWYPEGGYPARGDDFKRAVAAHLAARRASDTEPRGAHR